MVKTSNHIVANSFAGVRNNISRRFVTVAHEIHPKSWQGIDVSKKPDMITYELMNVTFTQSLGGISNLKHWQVMIEPNLPWADDHFLERVNGQPLNPGVEWANWPWGKSADNFREKTGQFNHNYMERYWPKYAGLSKDGVIKNEDGKWLIDRNRVRTGIRNRYGDLYDLVDWIVKNPLGREHWFPIAHPEDVGEVIGGRRPCTLGYQMMIRGGQWHMWYPMRSCDFMRHYNDDIYMTIRLGLWIMSECEELSPRFGNIVPGSFSMHCSSLHVFKNDIVQLREKYQ